MSVAVAPTLPIARGGGRRLRPAALATALAAATALAGAAVVLPGAPDAPAPVARTAPAAALLRALPLPAQLTVSRVVGADRPDYRVRGGAAATPAQALTERFAAAGTTVRTGADAVTLAARTLTADGRAIALPARAAPSVARNHVSYARGPVTEYYDNGPLGLEQGFRVAAPAAGARTVTLGVALSSATLTPHAAPGGNGLVLRDASGAVVLRYRGLVAHDARGHRLAATLHAAPGGAAIRVATAGARFPVTIDPVVQQGRLSAADAVAYQEIGNAVAIDGDTIVVANSVAVIAGNTQGALYVFTKPAGGWGTGTLAAKLHASDAGVGGNSTSNVYGDALGTSVAIDGDTIVAGAYRAVDGTQPYAGKLYVFVKPAGGWASGTQTAELGATDATMYDYLGTAVAIDGATIVGAAEGSGSGQHGAAYVYTKPAGGWTSATQNARLRASVGTADDAFGRAVAVAGDTIAVGAAYRSSGNGAVYLYNKPGGGWADGTEAGLATPATPIAHESMGYALAFDGTTLVAGAPNNYNPAADVIPSAYVFPRPGPGWIGTITTAVRLTEPNHTDVDHFGQSVGLDGSTIAVGAPFTAGTGGQSGGVFVYTRTGASWASTSAGTKVSGDAGGAQQASSVGLSGTTVVANAPYATVGSVTAAGAAYVFDTSGAGPGPGDPDPGTGDPGTGTGGTGTGGTGTGGTGTGGTSTPQPGATPTPAPAPGSVLTFVSTPTRVANDVGWGDVAANLLGITPGSGVSSNWGDFTFTAVCKNPAGCDGTISFGAQKPAPGATVARAAAAPKKVTPYAKASFSLRKGQKKALKVKLTAAARKLGRKHHKLGGYVTVAINVSATRTDVATRKLTLTVAKKKRAKK